MSKFLHGNNHNQTTNFTYLTWDELINKIETPVKKGNRKPETAKANSAVIASHDAKDKRKETAIKHDNFTMLRLDLDDIELTIEEVSESLKAHSIESFIIHTTASHKVDPLSELNRYRVYIELAESLVFEVWATIETYLSFLFKADDCATRPQQIMYLPFQSDNYQYQISTGEALNIGESELLVKAHEFREEQAEKEQAILSQLPIIKPTYKSRLIRNQVSIVDLVNACYEWDSLLPTFGYKKQGKAWLPPEATSKTAGAYILPSCTDGKERYYSHHSNDPCATERCIDKFDFICIRQFSNDATRALKEIAETHFPDEHAHNKQEFQKEMNSERVEALRSSFVEGGA